MPWLCEEAGVEKPWLGVYPSTPLRALKSSWSIQASAEAAHIANQGRLIVLGSCP